MNLHNEIMNIPSMNNQELAYLHGAEHHHTSYLLGHRDARHKAAELSLEAEARIEELESMLSRLVTENDLALPDENDLWMYSPMRVECLEILME